MATGPRHRWWISRISARRTCCRVHNVFEWTIAIRCSHHCSTHKPVRVNKVRLKEKKVQVSIIDSQRGIGPEAQSFAERRIRFALSRFSSRIRRVTAMISVTNGSSRGIEKSCRIAIKLRRGADINFTCLGSDTRTCVSRAADRAARAVSRVIDRERQFDRRRPRVA